MFLYSRKKAFTANVPKQQQQKKTFSCAPSLQLHPKKMKNTKFKIRAVTDPNIILCPNSRFNTHLFSHE